MNSDSVFILRLTALRCVPRAPNVPPNSKPNLQLSRWTLWLREFGCNMLGGAIEAVTLDKFDVQCSAA